MTADHEMTENDKDTRGETRVWQAVILQTVEEWMHGPRRQSLQAEQYLFLDNSDFPLVCQSAGMDVGRLRAGLKKVRDRTARQESILAAA